MASNPLIPQGTINRLRGSVSFTDLSQFNIVAGNLGKGAISIEWGGPGTDMLPQLTGAVPSPSPYILGTTSIELLKTQALANSFKTRIEQDTTMGQIVVRLDSAPLSPYTFENCAIVVPGGDLNAGGESAAYKLTIVGTYYINATLYNF